MSTDEEISAVSDIENAKKSDGTSTAGEHNIDKVNDIGLEERSNEKSTFDEENKSEDEVKIESTKRDINEVEPNDSTEEDEEEENEGAVSTTSNKKIKIIESSTDENDETSPEIPNEELTVV